ncbi:hypothetical protein IAR50_005951 [Cryptococcus sp. DSM 104548]
MKSLRRSLNHEKSNGSPQPSPPLPTSQAATPHVLGRPSEKVAPPQKVIKALASHQSTNPSELSYNKGDFWYVTGERGSWYEALNPLTGSRGAVPKQDFEEFVKGGKHPAGAKSIDVGSSRPNTPAHLQNSLPNSVRSPGPGMVSPPMSADSARSSKSPVYAIVQYDFQAERPDELEAKKGEPIVIMAQSNHEWFVAKPIGRLGGPGLIPVAFVEVRDPKTGQPVSIEPNSIPMVEEWKKKTADYKAAAIPLGRFDIGPGVTNSPYAPNPGSANASQTSLSRAGSTSATLVNPATGSSSTSATPAPTERSSKRPSYVPVKNEMLPPGDLTSMSVLSFHQENGVYWFRLNVNFVPDDPTASAYSFGLYRSYEDFYDFQIALLDTFPYEAGRPGSGNGRKTPERILPYMPGPVDYEIDDELTEYRREELDVYVKELLDLKSKGAGPVLRHELFRTFFATRHGDHFEKISREDAVEELQEQLADAQLDPRQSEGYSPNAIRSQSAASHHSQTSNQYRHSPQAYQGHAASRSVSSRGASPLPHLETHSRSNSYGRPTSGRQSGAAHHVSGGPSTGGTASSWGMNNGPPSASAVPTTPGTAPQQSGPPPYIKIKIYDRATDDLIAIRVHSAVTYADLFEKVRARLGPGVSVLRYRVSMDGQEGYRELRDDAELSGWLRTEGQKLVLYAEQ